MKVSLKNYSFRYLVPLLFVVIGIWAFLFYKTIVDEVYDNIDDGLKNQKIEIIREAYVDPNITKVNEFGVNQFRILKVSDDDYDESNHLTTEMVFMPYDGENEPYRVLRTGFHGVDKEKYILEIRTSMMEEDDMIFNLSISLIVLYVLILLSALVIHQVVIRKALKPFYAILDQIKQYRLGKNTQIQSVKSNVIEFASLEEEVIEMIDRNEEMYQQQKLFIENASHELQTPLAVTINELDLVLENTDMPEKEYLKITAAKDALWRMVHLNKSLLMLSRIDNHQYKMTDKVNFTEVLQNELETLSSIIEEKQLYVQCEKKGDFIVKFHPEMARVLLSNLLRNAIKHNNEEKKLLILIDTIELKIANSGSHIPLNPKLIYERFYKQGTAKNSNGLGLSIVKSIVEKQNAIALSYSFLNNLHEFKITKK